MKTVYKYATGQEIPKGAVYLCTVKNGTMKDPNYPEDYQFVWHYFLVDVKK
jgi:hypothetical protein